jgi:Tol biopolymer transport system component
MRPTTRHLAAHVVLAVGVALTLTMPAGSAAAESSRIVYSIPFTDAGTLVATVRPDGTGGAPVDTSSYVLEDFNQTVWSHDGQHLLHSNILRFDSAGNVVRFRPLITDPDGGNPRVLELADRPTDMYCTAWSLDDTRLVCGDAQGIFTMRASDGGGVVRLSHSPANATDQPVGFSPDGTKLAFVRKFGPVAPDRSHGSFPSEAAVLMVADADGTDARAITGKGSIFAGDFANAKWAPDGQMLITSTAHGTLVQIPVGGGDPLPVKLAVDGKSFAATPSYSPDGQHLVFALFRQAPADLYISDLDGSHVRQLTDAPGNEWFPDWR